MQEFRIDPETESIFESPIFVSSSFEFKGNWRGVGRFEVKSSFDSSLNSIGWILQFFIKIEVIDSCMIVNM